MRLYPSNAWSNFKNALLLTEIKIARATVSIKRVVELQKHVTFDRNENGPFDSHALEGGRGPKPHGFFDVAPGRPGRPGPEKESTVA